MSRSDILDPALEPSPLLSWNLPCPPSTPKVQSSAFWGMPLHGAALRSKFVGGSVPFIVSLVEDGAASVLWMGKVK